MVNRILSIPAAMLTCYLIGRVVDGLWAIPLAAFVAFSFGFLGAYLDDRQSSKDV